MAYKVFVVELDKYIETQFVELTNAVKTAERIGKKIKSDCTIIDDDYTKTYIGIWSLTTGFIRN